MAALTTLERPPAAVEPKRIPPVKIWATLGAVLLAFETYVVTKWVTGPNFKPVPSGPSDPPGWMKAVLNTVQYGGVVVMLVLFYVLIIRPWRRERRVTTDGLFAAVVFVCSVYDPLSNYFQHWFTYNSYLLNYGSVMPEMPGVLAPNGPGATQAWPVIMMPACYVYVFLMLMALGCWIMGRARRQWPRMSNPGLMGVVFLSMIAVDIVLEGLLFMPLGFWSYAGGRWLLFAGGSYFKFPLHQAVTFSLAFTSVVSLRFFRDDQGRTIAERGIDELAIGPRRKAGLRFLAVLAITELCLVVFYHLPQSLLATRSGPWPADVQKRSYLTNHVCGDGTDRACPGPGVPIPRTPSAYLDREGKLVVPDGVPPPQVVPFSR
jgi:hypothetical protein